MNTTEEIMKNSEEVVVMAEQIAMAAPKKGLKIAGIGAGVVLVAGLAYKFVIEPIVKKQKAKKEQQSEPAQDQAANEDSKEVSEN